MKKEMIKYLKRFIKEEDGILPVLGALAGLAGGAAGLAGAAPAVATGLGAVGGGLSALGQATQKGPGQPKSTPQSLGRTKATQKPDLNQMNQQLMQLNQSMQAMRDPQVPYEVRKQYSEPLMGAYIKLKSDLDKYQNPNMGGMR